MRLLPARAALALLALAAAPAVATERDPGPEAEVVLLECGGLASLTIDGAALVVEAALEAPGGGWTGRAAAAAEGRGGVVTIELTAPRSAAAGSGTVEVLAELALPKGVAAAAPWRLRVRGAGAPREAACAPAA